MLEQITGNPPGRAMSHPIPGAPDVPLRVTHIIAVAGPPHPLAIGSDT